MSRLICKMALIGVGLACVGARGQAKPESSDTKPGVAAYIGDQAISLADVDAKALATNMKLAQSMYEARKGVLDQLIAERVLAKELAERKITVDDLLKEKVAARLKPITDEQVQAFYDANKARMQGAPLEKVSGQIRGQLVSQQEGEARKMVLDELKATANVRVVLDPPRVSVAVADNAPMKGPANAKVTIVEISDFQ